MSRALTQCTRWTFGLVLALGPIGAAMAKDFAIRQVTNFGSPGAGTYAEPIGVANDRLIFLARENGVTGLYSTDGTHIELIDNSVTIFTEQVAQLGHELFFAARGPDGRELYATDGHSLRQVADLAPGPLSSNVGSGPSEFMVLNGRLLFHAITDPPSPSGVPARYFHTDGNTIEEFAYSLFSLSGSIVLGEELVYGGIVPGSGGPLLLHRTDGESATIIPTPELVWPPAIAKVGSYAYFVAGEGAGLGIHRTNGGTAELVSLLDDFTVLNRVEHMFEHNGDLILTMADTAKNELIFFRTNGGTPTEVLRWPIPRGVSLIAGAFERLPTFSDGEQAYFALRNGLEQELHVFDGDSFDFVAAGTGLGSSGFIFSELNGRVFVSSSAPTFQLKELVDGSLVPIGQHLENLVGFHDEIFGWNYRFTVPLGSLWQIKNGELISLGDIVNSLASRDQRFVEFKGQLYFAGQSDGNRQLFALVLVPEPNSLSHVGMMSYVFLIASMRRLRVVAHATGLQAVCS